MHKNWNLCVWVLTFTKQIAKKHNIRVCQMCQKFESLLFSVKFPLMDLSWLYNDQKFQNILTFRGCLTGVYVYTIV